MNCDQLIRTALKEDVGAGDITSLSVVPKDMKAKAKIAAKEKGVIAGLGVAGQVFRRVDRRIKFKTLVKDGARVKKGRVIALVSGPARGILTGERVALNFLQHLSGIATQTDKFRSKVLGLGSYVKILDTRKTLPGLRALEKYAVRMGGGVNHRLGLYDAYLIKDNHIKLAGGIRKAIRAAKAGRLKKPIEVEAKTLGQVKAALTEKADILLLDNMPLKTLRRAEKLAKKAGLKTEASGGVNINNIRAIAKTGVNFVSSGALTHSAPALDINLRIV